MPGMNDPTVVEAAASAGGEGSVTVRLVAEAAVPELPAGKFIEYTELAKGDCLGRGAFAEVFKGRNKECAIALKISKQTFSLDEVDSLVGESRVHEGLSHDNIVKYLGHSVEADQAGISKRTVLVLEYCDHGALQDTLFDQAKYPSSNFSWLTRRQIGAGITSGLAYLHRQKVLHRDLKPENVLLTEDVDGGYVPKISDFGISIRREAETVSVSRRGGDRIGTYRWMAPEVLAGFEDGESQYSNKSDVYSLALILWALWARQAPYLACPKNESSPYLPFYLHIAKRKKRELISDRQDENELEDWYKELIEKGWAPEKAERPTAAEIDCIFRERGVAREEAINEVEAVVEVPVALPQELKGNEQADFLRDRGRHHYQQRQFLEAVDYFTQSLVRRPNDVHVLSCRGLSYKRSNQLEKAIDDFTHVLSINPKDAFALMKRGKIYVAQGEYPKAVADFKQILEQNPNHAEALSALQDAEQRQTKLDSLVTLHALTRRGQAYLGRRQYEEASSDFEAALKIDFTFEEAFLGLKKVKRLQIEYLLKSAKTNQEQGRCQEALADFDRVLILEPNDVFALSRRGDIYRRQGNFASALVDLNKALNDSPNYTFALSRRGEVYRRQGQYELALDDFKAALSANKKSVVAFAGIGAIYWRQGKDGLAVEMLDKALSCNRNNVLALSRRASIYQKDKQNEAALRLFSRALDKDKQHVFSLICRAEIYVKKKQFNLALTDLTTVLSIDSKNALVLSRRGYVYQQLGQYNLAVKDFDASLAINPRNARVLSLRFLIKRKAEKNDAVLRRDAGELLQKALRMKDEKKHGMKVRAECDATLRYFSACLTLDPTNIQALLERGELYAEMGMHEEALVDFSAVLAIVPGTIDEFCCAYYRRATVYGKLKKYTEALEDVCQALKINPKDLDALSRRGEIYRLQGKYRIARCDFEAVLEKNSKHVFTLSRCGAMCLKQKHYHDAVECLNAALELEPDHLFARACWQLMPEPYRGCRHEPLESRSVDPAAGCRVPVNSSGEKAPAVKKKFAAPSPRPQVATSVPQQFPPQIKREGSAAALALMTPPPSASPERVTNSKHCLGSDRKGGSSSAGRRLSFSLWRPSQPASPSPPPACVKNGAFVGAKAL